MVKLLISMVYIRGLGDVAGLGARENHPEMAFLLLILE
jgi:hypothetical protein